LLCDEKGTLIDGDDIMAIAGLDLLAQGKLAKRTVVSTVMSNAGLDTAIQAAGGQVVRTAWDRQVIDEMLRHSFNPRRAERLRSSATTAPPATACRRPVIWHHAAREASQLAQCWTRFPRFSPTS
jgi:phosphoglucosamine mutase